MALDQTALLIRSGKIFRVHEKLVGEWEHETTR